MSKAWLWFWQSFHVLVFEFMPFSLIPHCYIYMKFRYFLFLRFFFVCFFLLYFSSFLVSLFFWEIYAVWFEPRRQKTGLRGFRPGPTQTGLYSHRRWLRDLKFRIWKAEALYYPSGENKGADQLRGHREADLRLCFRICKNPVFSRRGSFCICLVFQGFQQGKARTSLPASWCLRFSEILVLYVEGIESKIMHRCEQFSGGRGGGGGPASDQNWFQCVCFLPILKPIPRKSMGSRPQGHTCLRGTVFQWGLRFRFTLQPYVVTHYNLT